MNIVPDHLNIGSLNATGYPVEVGRAVSLIKESVISESCKKKLGLKVNSIINSSYGEYLGRSYGGGVLQLMPTEARNLPVPVPASMMTLPDANIMRSLHRLDQTMRHEQAGSISINDVIRKQGDMIGQTLGLTASQRGMILSAWNLMRNRRHRKG